MKYIVYLFLTIICFSTLPFAPRIEWLSAEDSGGGNLVKQVFLVFIFLVCLFYNFKGGLNFNKYYPLFILVIVFFVSAVFSDNYEISLKRAALFFVITFTVILFFEKLGAEMFLKCAINFSRTVLFLTVISLLVPSAYHLSSDPEPSTVGAFRGLFYHKNINGSFFAVLSIIFAYSYAYYDGSIKLKEFFNRRQLLAFLTISLFFVFLSKSSTSIIFSVLLVVFILSLKNSRRFFFSACFSTIVFAIASFLVFISFYAEDNPEALTGRGLIWTTILSLIDVNGFWGVGYGALYGAGDSGDIGEYSNLQEAWLSNIASGHNGYLDILITTGWAGLFCSVVALIFIPFFILNKKGFTLSNGLSFSLLVFCVLYNFLESSFSDKSKLISTLMMIVVVSVYSDD